MSGDESATTQEHAAFRGVVTYLAASEFGAPPSGEDLVSFVSLFSWRRSFLKLSELAAIMVYDQEPFSPRIQQRTVAALRALHFARARNFVLLPRYLRMERPLAHEAVIYLLQALVLLHGSEDDAREPTDAGIALMLLMANDFVPRWADESEVPDRFTLKERNLAESTRILQYNQYHYRTHALIRGSRMLAAPPPRTPQWRDLQSWHALQVRAFKMPFSDYMESLALPLYFHSTIWGGDDKAGNFVQPIFAPRRWLSETNVDTSLGTAFLSDLAWTRDEARTVLRQQMRSDGTVSSPTIFFRRPFVWLTNDEVVAATPWVVRDQL